MSFGLRKSAAAAGATAPSSEQPATSSTPTTTDPATTDPATTDAETGGAKGATLNHSIPLSETVSRIAAAAEERATTLPVVQQATPAWPAMPTPLAPVDWTLTPAYDDLGPEMKIVGNRAFQQPVPLTFLSPRVVMDIQPANAMLTDCAAQMAEAYTGIDPLTPSSMPSLVSTMTKKSLTCGDQVRAVAEFVSGHLAHQVSLPEWQKLFDLQHMEMENMYFLWIIHLQIINRRAVGINISRWARRRETMQEMLMTMYDSWETTCQSVMGRAPTMRMQTAIRSLYNTVASNFDEAMRHDGPGADLMLLAVLMKMCPLPRPEDLPLYTYYTLIHYIRFHTALFDRLSDDDFCRGKFHFLQPNDPRIFKSYTDVEFDTATRSWVVESEAQCDASAAASSEGGPGQNSQPN